MRAVCAGIDLAKAKQGQHHEGDRASDIWSVVDLHSEPRAAPAAAQACALPSPAAGA
jgi:hypothetical protein